MCVDTLIIIVITFWEIRLLFQTATEEVPYKEIITKITNPNAEQGSKPSSIHIFFKESNMEKKKKQNMPNKSAFVPISMLI